MSHVAFTRAHAALAAALIASLLLHCERALACSCVTRTPAEAYAQAVSVFEGNVLEIREPAHGHEGSAAERALHIRLSVVRSWKGMEQEQVEIVTAPTGAECGFTFTVDQNYLIYASSNARGLSVDLCSRTRPIDQAGEDLHVLGLGATPVDPHAPESEKTVNTVSAQPRPATKGGCASCAISPSREVFVPSAAAVALVVVVAYRTRRRAERSAPAPTKAR
jgi:hypothetical protein